ncbi:MAG: hypothetical protein ABJC12_12470, partial [Saprospiraceae bacterium]
TPFSLFSRSSFSVFAVRDTRTSGAHFQYSWSETRERQVLFAVRDTRTSARFDNEQHQRRAKVREVLLLEGSDNVANTLPLAS